MNTLLRNQLSKIIPENQLPQILGTFATVFPSGKGHAHFRSKKMNTLLRILLS
jgi:hypothetical protein